jgi:hypothetical protein
MNNPYRKAFVICLLIIVFLICLLRFPADDGLRHVGLAFGNFTSWGEVYPFSIFEDFKDYDPWFGYDLSLRLIADALKHLPVSLLIQKFLLTKSLALLFSLVFCYLILVRSGLLAAIKDRETFTMAVIIFIALLGLPFGRISLARPFAFGTLFLIYSVGQKGVIRGFLSSLALTFFYPYLSWFYILPVAFAHFVKGNKKFAISAVSCLIIFLWLQPSSFWGFQIALVNSDVVRKAIDSKILEFHLTLTDFSFYFYLAGLLIFYPKFSKDVRNLNYINILILIYLLPALKYIRYFLDLTLPLLFVNFAKEIFYILLEPYQKFTAAWKDIIADWLNNIKTSTIGRFRESGNIQSHSKSKPSRSLKPYIVITYLIICVFLIYINSKQLDSLSEFRDGLMPVNEGSLVLASFNLQYSILYLRPDLHVIPSCEMGFAKKSVLKEYLDFLNKGSFSPLSRKTGATYLLESNDIILNPQDGRFLKLLKKNGRLKVWRILAPSNENTP